MKYYIIAGEASGDLHAGNLIASLKKKSTEANFKGFGGEKMEEAGCSISLHYREMAFMGVWEVVQNYGKIRANFNLCEQDILDYKPDALILVDYAGFNLRMAKFAKEHNIPTYFYISPKVWAWKKSRIKKIKAFVDRLFVILPFEKDYFAQRNYQVDYVGNPLIDAIEKFKSDFTPDRAKWNTENNIEDKPVLALLAGSRKQEIKRCLPEMLAATNDLGDYERVIAGAPSIPESYYKQVIGDNKVKIVYNKTYELLSYANLAVVTSGTATLETALFHVPEVVIYKTSWPTFIIARPFVWIKYFSLVNLIMDKLVVKELLQFNLTNKIKDELDLLINNSQYKDTMVQNYADLSHRMGQPGTSDRTAGLIIEYQQKPLKN